MDAPCKVQRNIHVLCLIQLSMCPGFWVHITLRGAFLKCVYSIKEGKFPIKMNE